MNICGRGGRDSGEVDIVEEIAKIVEEVEEIVEKLRYIVEIEDVEERNGGDY